MNPPTATGGDEPFRVLQLTKFYPPVKGGIESVTFELTRGLNRRGIPTDVLCANTGAATVVERGAGEYTIVRAGTLTRVQSTSVAPALVTQLARRVHGYDLVHVHLPDPMAALAVRAVRPKCAVVLHWHADVIRQRRAMRVYEPFQRWLLRRADAVITTSPPYAEASPWLQPFRDKTRVIPIGIEDPGRPNGDLSQSPGLPVAPGQRVVFALGRMSAYKGFEILIDAMAMLPDDVSLVIGGDGAELERYRGRVRALGLGDRVALPGRLTDAQVRAWMHRADVFCLSSISRAEAFGVVLLEAMSAGTAIVTTRIEGSGVPWVVPDGVAGVQVRPGSAQELASGLQKVLDDPTQARVYGAAGRERFQEMFTANLMVDATLDLYREILSGGRGDRHSAPS